MSMSKIAVLAACSFVAVQAHMQLGFPPPFQAGNNPHKTGEGDSTYNAPMGCCGYNNTAICRGYLDLLGTPAGASVATWKAGSTATWSLTGEPSAALNDLGDTHYGGSCQVGFSTDGGKTFRVAASYEGNCPHRKDSANSGQDFTFTVPSDIPNGEAVFAWTWINREQEFNMNCAAVTITDGAAGGNDAAQQGSQQSAVPSVASKPVSQPSSEPSYVVDSDPAAATEDSQAQASAVPTKASEAATTVARGVSSASNTPSSSKSSGKYKLDWCQCSCDESSTTLNKEQAYTASGCSCQCWKAPTTTSSKREAHMARHVHNRSGFAENSAPIEGRDTTAVAWNSRPQIFIPNPIWHDCQLPLTDWELSYPNPGPQVIKGDGEYPMKTPSTAQCTSNTSDD
ncbi:uncharacterized protein J3D65DRAFT_659668 [Phyllosticta citribraziliensis]|uniref:Lytic polysaccharide monooxygenase n=1 Tax=Phyllosticta citribraziliensis TaxID=989973 RepID=A0ABR1LLM6_9PEZI